ncbi:DNA polymerase IV [Verrucomicrobia bacterium]|nr:DNA polymerase IV [Verrucomicrobiota bacterium]MDB4642145.1 DNA polymerase IV [Verrucomicrobiota bacterium]
MRKRTHSNDLTTDKRVIMHVDMDAFFASVEQRDRPELKGKPVIVGSPPDRRGVVCAASYEARKFGVRSAMPSRTAKTLCPHGIFLSPCIDKYRQESHEIMKLIRCFCEKIEQMSVDEAYLDLSGRCLGNDFEASLMSALPIAREIKTVIRRKRQLRISIGIASNKMLAKIASDYDKPNGLVLIPERDKQRFLASLPVRSIHGVGKASNEILNKAGLHTIGDIQEYKGELVSLMGNFGPLLKQYALGVDDRRVESNDSVKSISSETTFLRDTDNRNTLKSALKEQAEEIAGKLTRQDLFAHTIQVKVRYGDFTTLSRQTTLPEGIQDTSAIYRNVCQMLARERLVNQPLRLVGISASKLWNIKYSQLKLPLAFEPEDSGANK